MKSISMKTTFFSFTCMILLLISCGQKENQSTPSTNAANHNQKATASVENTVSSYLKIKNSLVASDTKEAANAAKAFAETIVEEEEKNMWITFASRIHQSEKLEEQRVAFQQLSDALINYYSQNTAPDNLYVQYCPMAFNNTGAYWISDSEEVLNPYFGDQMLRCGYVAATIQ